MSEDPLQQFLIFLKLLAEMMADLLTAIMEGGIVTSLTLNEPDILVRQILQYRDFIRLQFGDV